jgi:hypothetical protein
MVQVNQVGLKLNGTHDFLVYGVDINKLGGSLHDIKKNTEALIVASKGIGVEVNADKSKYEYMIMSRDHNARRNHKERWLMKPLKGWNRSNAGEQP